MKAGIDARTLLSNRRGFWRVRCLLPVLMNQQPDFECILFAEPELHPAEWCLPENFSWENPARRLRMLHRRGVGLLGRRMFRGMDVFHFPTPEVWYSKYAPTIVTLHDLAPLHFPDKFFRSSKERSQYEKHLERIAANADIIATVSEYSRKDIITRMRVQPERVRTIYQGFESMQTQAANTTLPGNIPPRFFLYCGGLDFRKNVDGLIQAFAIYKNKFGGKAHLVITGEPANQPPPFQPDLPKLAEKLNLSNQILFTGWVNDNTLAALYRSALTFVFPSLFEGFGFTPLEAMEAGTPVICSNRASLPEVAGDAALMADATDPEALAEALRNVEEDELLRRSLVEKGKMNLQRFNWNETAKEFIALYREVASTSKS
jgi:glycosyltransferase involved in cell wall biosynthesis